VSTDFHLIKRAKHQNEIDQHSITAEGLQSLMASGQKVLLFDVRQPLDLLAYPQIIPGAHRIPPKRLIPKDKDAVVYCTVRVTRPGEQFCAAHWHFGS
jgi:hypothetical protein